MSNVKALLHKVFFSLATFNANLGEKYIAGSCRILDICRVLREAISLACDLKRQKKIIL